MAASSLQHIYIDISFNIFNFHADYAWFGGERVSVFAVGFCWFWLHAFSIWWDFPCLSQWSRVHKHANNQLNDVEMMSLMYHSMVRSLVSLAAHLSQTQSCPLSPSRNGAAAYRRVDKSNFNACSPPSHHRHHHCYYRTIICLRLVRCRKNTLLCCTDRSG